MQTIESTKNRVREILNDEEGARYTDLMLENAIRQALGRVDDNLPLMRKLEYGVSATAREVIITSLVNPLFILQVSMIAPQIRELKKGYECLLQGATCKLEFTASYIPQAGDRLLISYAARNLLCGLDGATESTLPDSALPALESSAVSFAYMLKAASLLGVYGGKAGEPAQLVEQSKVWKDLAESALSKLRSYQPFEFAEGFALDRWDQ